MSRENEIYLYRRAECELERAQRATHPKAAAAHHQMAEAYLQRMAAAGHKA